MRWLIVALMLFASAGAEAQTVKQMQAYCKTLDIPSGDDTKSKPLMIPNTLEAGMCWGAFSTFSAAAMFVRKDDGRRLLGICSSPQAATIPHMIDVFMRAANEHLESSQEEFGPLALKALQDAFPCPK
jgi:hypothetical protein